MGKDFLIEAIVGNSRLLASIGAGGELSRLFWPHIDTPQNIGKDKLGLFIDEQEICWLSDKTWQAKPSYILDTNIYQVVVELPHKIKVTLTIFAAVEQDLLVRRLEVSNLDNRVHTIKLLHYSEMLIGGSPRHHTTVFQRTEEVLWQFKHDSHFLTGADAKALAWQCNCGEFKSARQLKDLAYFMCSNGAVLWQLGLVEPDTTRETALYTAMAGNLIEAEGVLKEAKLAGSRQLIDKCSKYWHDYLAGLMPIKTAKPALDILYKRSLLVFPLLTDYQYGSMLAAPEADEDFTLCGGYGFCWGRDAAFITYAMDLAGLNEAAKKFYRWAMRAQNKDGSWEQRHYLDGALAPNWGMQIDETASIVWGMWQHYEITKEEQALAEFWPALKKGADFLVSFIDEATGLPKPSYDLWEERTGEHTYSAAAVWAGLDAAHKAASVYGAPAKAAVWRETAGNVKKAIFKQLWDEDSACFLRGVKVSLSNSEFEYLVKQHTEALTEQLWKQEKIVVDKDPIVDSSLLGLTFPFAFLPADDKRMRKVAKIIEERLTSPKTGGIKRYENDRYIGGNPWILCTLWLALYYIKAGDEEKGASLLNWVLTHQTEMGLLSEQIDRETGKPAWIIPLTWSHAMLILTVQFLYNGK